MFLVTGVLMMTAWTIFVCTAIMLARYYKTAWPEKKLCDKMPVWFSVSKLCDKKNCGSLSVNCVIKKMCGSLSVNCVIKKSVVLCQ